MNGNWKAFVNENVLLEPAGSGRLDGLSFAVKDVFSIRGYTSGAGNPDWLRTHGAADRHAAAIDLLLRQGARLKGTTHTDELMFSLNGENSHYGTPVNPKAPDRIPGGSSSGSAVAVAAGLVDFALGTDTGGSVRIPSAYCGVYGFRPTHGVVPVEGVIPLAESFDTVGWMARNPQTLQDAGLALICGDLPAEGGFRRILFGTDVWEIADPDCHRALSVFIPLLQSLAEQSRWIEVAEQGLAGWMNTFRILQGLEIWAAHGEWIRKEMPAFGPGIAERFAWTAALQAEQCEGSFRLRDKIRTWMSELLGEDGLLVVPTAPGIAPPLRMSGDEMERRRNRTLQMSCIAGLAGLPQITLPAGEVYGYPLGLSVIAGPRQDLKLLAWVNGVLDKKLFKKEDAYVSEI